MRRHSLICMIAVGLLIGSVACDDGDSARTDSPDSGTSANESADGSTGTSGATADAATDLPDTSTVDPSDAATSVADESSPTYDADDLVENADFAHAIRVDLSAMQAWTIGESGAEGERLEITADGTTIVSADETAVILSRTDVGVTIASTVDAAIRYELSGALSGTLTVESEKKYALVLDGVDITAAQGPALNLQSKKRVFLILADGSQNTLTDAAERGDDLTMKAALYGKGQMIFSGAGALTVNGHYKHGIFSGDYIRVRGGAIAVNVDARDAIRTDNGFIFDDGDLVIRGTGSVIDEESKGIKVDGAEGNEDALINGIIAINGGAIDIETVSKAITASWDIDEDATTSDTADDPTPSVTVNSGHVTIKTTGTPYERVVDGVEVSLSPEGIEGKSSVTINGGYVVVNTTDDSINAGQSVAINGGYLYAHSSDNDAIDSNGTISIGGGVLVAIGAGAPEGAFDCDQNTFAITGGTMVGIGGAYSTPTERATTQNTVLLGSGTAGQTLALLASDGRAAFAFDIPLGYSTMVLSTPKIATGATYSVTTGCAANSSEQFYGLHLGDITCAGGAGGTSFTVSSTVTQVGGGAGGGGPGGGGPGGF